MNRLKKRLFEGVILIVICVFTSILLNCSKNNVNSEKYALPKIGQPIFPYYLDERLIRDENGQSVAWQWLMKDCKIGWFKDKNCPGILCEPETPCYSTEDDCTYQNCEMSSGVIFNEDGTRTIIRFTDGSWKRLKDEHINYEEAYDTQKPAFGNFWTILGGFVRNGTPITEMNGYDFSLCLGMREDFRRISDFEKNWKTYWTTYLTYSTIKETTMFGETESSMSAFDIYNQKKNFVIFPAYFEGTDKINLFMGTVGDEDGNMNIIGGLKRFPLSENDLSESLLYQI